jgi:hypothetical protein
MITNVYHLDIRVQGVDRAIDPIYIFSHVATKKRRKPVRKDKGILIRVTEAQKEALAEAAEKAGLGLSSWMLTVALREIQRAEGGGGK